MNEQLTAVVADGADPGVVRTIRATIAALPESFALVDGAADVLVVDGSATGWARQALQVPDGVRAVLVVGPVPVDPADLQRLRDAGLPVVLDAAWRHADAVARIAPDLAAALRPRALLEGRTAVGTAAELPQAVLDLAFTAAALVGAVPTDLREVVRTDGQLIAAADLGGGASASFSAVVASHGRDEAAFRLVTEERTVAVRLAPPDSGRPGVASTTSWAERTVLPAAFESAHRSALRHLHAAVIKGSGISDLADFAGLVRVAATVLG